ncbi:hypothetical protein JQC72_09645 [Polycladomyces sp. WAk]|uniref:Uncharacterized protein n=1 Tax=Polycladomyces zharkentensis TaxID=2807616 RepID=A0ABS2WJR0_9BACL|nr:hypothetical protein [Polycladomyces sp. WAk]MBN2909787.1 hypothetical protein [Polycladomyces sp. WAk]
MNIVRGAPIFRFCVWQIDQDATFPGERLTKPYRAENREAQEPIRGQCPLSEASFIRVLRAPVRRGQDQLLCGAQVERSGKAKRTDSPDTT